MQMPATEILENVSKERLQGWLGSVAVPTLVKPQFFEDMGFRPVFVRQFLKKHAKVLRFDGTIARGVRGINELELLRGLADALGVRPFADQWDPRDIMTTTAVARACLHTLEMMPQGQRSATCPTHGPNAVAETTDSVAGAES